MLQHWKVLCLSWLSFDFMFLISRMHAVIAGQILPFNLIARQRAIMFFSPRPSAMVSGTPPSRLQLPTVVSFGMRPSRSVESRWCGLCHLLQLLQRSSPWNSRLIEKCSIQANLWVQSRRLYSDYLHTTDSPVSSHSHNVVVLTVVPKCHSRLLIISTYPLNWRHGVKIPHHDTDGIVQVSSIEWLTIIANVVKF